MTALSSVAPSQQTSKTKRGITADARPGAGRGKNQQKSGLAGSTENEKLVSFEMASYDLEDYPNEKIVYLKFLDDNDPRLLLLVTYHEALDTTYMKVLKIEKAKTPAERAGRH